MHPMPLTSRPFQGATTHSGPPRASARTSSGAPRRAVGRQVLGGLLATMALAGCAGLSPGDLAGLDANQRRLLAWHSRPDPGPSARQGTLRAAADPMPLPVAAPPSPIVWQWQGRPRTLDEYLRRQPVAALLIARHGRIVHESYRFGVTPDLPFLSNSIAKSVTSLAVGYALHERRIRDLSAPASRYVPELAGTLHGDTAIRDLMRMGSGARFVETYRPGDDASRFRQGFQRVGVIAALREFGERQAAPGTRFNYAGPDVAVLSAVVRGATGESIADYLSPRLWQAMGAEAPARWDRDPTGLELTQCCLRARPRDYLRLGIVLAHDGRRPDTGALVIPPDYLLASTDVRGLEAPFRPGGTGLGIGYHNLFWILPTPSRQFALIGVHGQAIFVDPGQRLVMVHLAVNATAHASETTMAAERAALWRGVVHSAQGW